jgi:hypothetical protein
MAVKTLHGKINADWGSVLGVGIRELEKPVLDASGKQMYDENQRPVMKPGLTLKVPKAAIPAAIVGERFTFEADVSTQVGNYLRASNFKVLDREFAGAKKFDMDAEIAAPAAVAVAEPEFEA